MQSAFVLSTKGREYDMTLGSGKIRGNQRGALNPTSIPLVKVQYKSGAIVSVTPAVALDAALKGLLVVKEATLNKYK
jgi:hypothetical protein